MKDYEKTYEKFWKDICEKDGEVNMDQVKRELHDFLSLANSASQVYEHVTGYICSKPNTDPDVVCRLADDRIDDIVKDAIDEYEDCTS